MSLGWKELHHLLGLDPAEDRDSVFNGVASLNTAKRDEISFLGNSRYAPQLKTTRAGVVLVPPGQYEASDGCQLIEVENPSGDFSKFIDYFQPEFQPFEAGISVGALVADDVELDSSLVSVASGAVIQSGAKIGRGSTIGPGAVIGKGAVVGEDCLIHANVSIREFCVVGNRVIIQPGAVIGSDGYGYDLVEGRHQKVPQVGIAELADDVEVGANSCVDRARFGKTYVGEGTKIDNLVQIAHNVEIGKHCIIVAQTGIAGSTRIGNYVTVAAQSGIAGHLEIGDQVVIGGRGAVWKSLPDAGVYLGNPARPIKGEQKRMALVNRLPKLVKEVQELKKKLEELTSE